jgi:hypothetical protein
MIWGMTSMAASRMMLLPTRRLIMIRATARTRRSILATRMRPFTTRRGSSIVAAITFFGLAGMAAQSADFAPGRTFVIALAAGGAAMYGVHQMMQLLYKLRSDGTARIERSLGHTGSVYLRIPGGNSGVGKVTINLRDRTVEYLAVTSQGPLPTGAKIVVTRVVSSDTVEVEPVTAGIKETSHA